MVALSTAKYMKGSFPIQLLNLKGTKLVVSLLPLVVLYMYSQILVKQKYCIGFTVTLEQHYQQSCELDTFLLKIYRRGWGSRVYLSSEIKLRTQILFSHGPSCHVAEKIFLREFTAVTTSITVKAVLQEHWDFSVQCKKASPAHPSDHSVQL